jgi:hypothetical protein
VSVELDGRLVACKKDAAVATAITGNPKDDRADFGTRMQGACYVSAVKISIKWVVLVGRAANSCTSRSSFVQGSFLSHSIFHFLGAVLAPRVGLGVSMEQDQAYSVTASFLALLLPKERVSAHSAAQTSSNAVASPRSYCHHV